MTPVRKLSVKKCIPVPMLRFDKPKNERDKLFVDLRRFLKHFPTEPFIKMLLLCVLKQLLHDKMICIPSHENKYLDLIWSQCQEG